MNKSSTSRQTICVAGERLFSQYGLSAVGIKVILDEVGIPKGSFYHYFKSKEAFAVSVAQQYFEQHIATIAFADDADFKQNLSVMLTAYHAMIDHLGQANPVKGCLLANLMIEATDSYPQLTAALNELYGQWISALTQLFYQGQQQGFIAKERDTSLLAHMFWNQWQGVVLRLKLDKDTQVAKRTLVQTVQLMTR
ncbi:TetR/AcrR family transcriptional regulator [Shewanella intestini]|uniref:TetR/AcrR family transcriptional regulator n=1 Tax=Shewanella intestini TaxID=2017544 RepID=A0ABS5I3J4_9GAMM|nr:MULTISPECIES: TetR/AcrR family transcriptional regulator [Shewanella]MBR9728597.1 TetR/AcrR family transcriptional regulator [Shewanella intestini]MRG37346.1 TetR family transcriptional regulator [Shewanella sp. XMDDZSB0408]